MTNKTLSLADVDVVVFDLDGTVYYGTKIIPGANEAIRFFRDNEKDIFFATNNSTKTRKQIYDRLIGMGIDCQDSEVLTSGYLAALYAKRNDLKNLYVFGSENLIEEFNCMGVSVLQDESAENLLIGYNPDMTYDDLAEALQVALHARCIIACNKERTYPGENARQMPGCGAMTAPIEWCANRGCDIVIGKPNTLMIDLISKERGVDPSRMLIVGDTYDSDVRMAFRAGCHAILIDKVSRTDVVTLESIGNVPEVFLKE